MIQTSDERFDKEFPKIGHVHDENCEWGCHLRSDIKAFIRQEIELAVKEERERLVKYFVEYYEDDVFYSKDIIQKINQEDK